MSDLIVKESFWMLFHFFNHFISHFEFLVFSRYRCWEMVHELRIFWNFVVGNFVDAKVVNIAILYICPLLKFNHSDSLFSVLRIWNANHLNIMNSWHFS